MCMASATIMKFPDGRTESKNILTSFDKNGTNVIVFETDKVDNGHKVVGVSYLSDGMYQNIVDPTKWNEVKGYLVDILHDRMALEDYRLVPEEIMVTVDPYHPLGLRDENLDKMVASYEAFKATKEVSIEQVQENPVEEKTEEIEPTDSIIESVPQVNEEVVLNDAPLIVDEQLPKEEGLTEETKSVEVEPVLDPFAIADSLEASANTMESTHEDIVPPVGVDIVDSPVIDTQVLNSIEPESVVENVPINEEVNISFPQPVLEPQNSVVKDAYLNGADAIIQQMRDTTEKYLNEMNELQENYIKEMEEMRSEISRNLEEARGINELSKQTFDKAQSLSPIEQPVLELTRAA